MAASPAHSKFFPAACETIYYHPPRHFGRLLTSSQGQSCTVPVLMNSSPVIKHAGVKKTILSHGLKVCYYRNIPCMRNGTVDNQNLEEKCKRTHMSSFLWHFCLFSVQIPKVRWSLEISLPELQLISQLQRLIPLDKMDSVVF